MHRLLIENRATKEVEALHGEMLDRVVKAIGSLKQNPRPHGVKKLFVEDGWRIRKSIAEKHTDKGLDGGLRKSRPFGKERDWDSPPHGFGYMESQTIALLAYRAINGGRMGRLVFNRMVFMCAYIDKYSPENGGGEKGSDSIYHSYTPFEIEWLMNRNIMVKAIPLNAKPTLKLGAKNEAKVKATKERLARSSSFPAYNLRWNSFSSILNDSIIGNLFCQELCSKMRGLGIGDPKLALNF